MSFVVQVWNLDFNSPRWGVRYEDTGVVFELYGRNDDNLLGER